MGELPAGRFTAVSVPRGTLISMNQPDAPRRCDWAESSDAMRAYHDDEWGRPSRDDRYLFEMLLLEGAQAGLSWATILGKRANYRRALDGFDPDLIVGYDPAKLAELLADPGIVRNRLKIAATVTNARAFLATQQQHGTFASYLWAWVDGTPLVNRPRSTADLPASTELSNRVSKDLKRRGFTFVGSTIIYSFLQAVGVVNDHLAACPILLSCPTVAPVAGSLTALRGEEDRRIWHYGR
jgi:DNA-3-methyladenine glycosylase I